MNKLDRHSIQGVMLRCAHDKCFLTRREHGYSREKDNKVIYNENSNGGRGGVDRNLNVKMRLTFFYRMQFSKSALFFFTHINLFCDCI